MRAPGLMVCGTGSDVGKSRIVAGLCRLFARRGLRVAPFKAQNMALNSFVTETGHEIARSQANQAAAACVVPEVAMNPVLLKPTGMMRSQLVVMGRPVGEVAAGEYARRNEALFETVLAALGELRSRYDLVLAEGAGGAAEINLLEAEIVNLPLARRAGLPAILVGDIERGGVFASLFGTVALLPEELAACLGGFVINKFRGDKGLLTSGVEEIERRTGLGCLGVLPHLGPLVVDSEDSLALEQGFAGEGPVAGEVIDVAVVRLPRLSNFTDFDPLALEPGVRLRYVSTPAALNGADLVVLPGSKTTVSDLDWLRRRGFSAAIEAVLAQGGVLLGICAGYQMLGTVIDDEHESRAGRVAGLGLIEVETSFVREKTTRQSRGRDLEGNPVSGYEVHHGLPRSAESLEPWFVLERDDGAVPEGVATEQIFATSLHGLFEGDQFRWAFLSGIARRRGKSVFVGEMSYESRRQAEIDKVADSLEENLDLQRLEAVLGEATR